MAIPSFNKCIDIAVHKVTAKYPHAQLSDARGWTNRVEPTTDPADIHNYQVRFQNVDRTSITIAGIDGEFGAPVLNPQELLGEIQINWADVQMDLDKANALKERAGYDKPYDSVILIAPLVKERMNPQFEFSVDGQKVARVDTVTGEVYPG
jgi:hypothetical protein